MRPASRARKAKSLALAVRAGAWRGRGALGSGAISSSNGSRLVGHLGACPSTKLVTLFSTTTASTSARRWRSLTGTSASPRPASRSSAPAPRCAPAAAPAWPAGCWLRTSSATTRPRRTRFSACGGTFRRGSAPCRRPSCRAASGRRARLRPCGRSRPGTQRLAARRVRRGLTSASITARLVARQQAELDLALEVLADVGAQRLDRAVARCRATWRTPRRPRAGAAPRSSSP